AVALQRGDFTAARIRIGRCIAASNLCRVGHKPPIFVELEVVPLNRRNRASKGDLRLHTAIRKPKGFDGEGVITQLCHEPALVRMHPRATAGKEEGKGETNGRDGVGYAIHHIDHEGCRSQLRHQVRMYLYGVRQYMKLARRSQHWIAAVPERLSR